MNVQSCLAGFKNCESNFPYDSVTYVLQNQHEMAPHLLEIIKHVLQNYKEIDLLEWEHIFALYLLSQIRYKQAFPYIIELARLPENILEDLLGDIIFEGLSRFMISTFQGDVDAIKALIEDENVCINSRIMSINALLGLVANEYITRDELLLYFSSLLKSDLMNDKHCADSLLNALAILWPKDLYDEIVVHLPSKQEERWKIMTLSELNRMIAMGKDACLKEHLYGYLYHHPIKDTINELKQYQYFLQKNDVVGVENDIDGNIEDVFDDECDESCCLPDLIITYQIVRSQPKIGRNDACPCSSGKKYKKCCLISNPSEQKDLLFDTYDH